MIPSRHRDPRYVMFGNGELAGRHKLSSTAFSIRTARVYARMRRVSERCFRQYGESSRTAIQSGWGLPPVNFLAPLVAV